jgi:hypothetical protein
MTIETLLEYYEEGRMTSHAVAVSAINLVDPSSVNAVMRALPEKIKLEVLEYAVKYRPNKMISINLETPSPESIECVKRYFQEHRDNS